MEPRFQAALQSKPISQYEESYICSTWPAAVRDTLNEYLSLTQQTKKSGETANLLEPLLFELIDNIYREGFRDGLALSSWLEKGPIY